MSESQTFVPASVMGRMTLMSRTVNGAITPADAARIETETVRRWGVQRRRLYYAGQQFDETNQAEAKRCPPTGNNLAPVPEHRRLHAYSTQICECVDFIANRLGAGFSIEATSSDVKRVVTEMVEASDTIYALDEKGEVQAVTDDVLREALIAGDTPVYVGWDPVEERAYLEFWECESVEFRMRNRTEVDQVIRYDMVWDSMASGVEALVEERVVYTLRRNEVGYPEAHWERWIGDESGPRDEGWLGIGRIPWTLLKSDSKGLRSVRGESLISEQAMDTADRFNAVEQTGFLIARYNSHSNVAVIGDAASLKVESDGRVSKDVADVLTFPGGTSLQVLTLPTNPEMIDHQRDVLADALFSSFGVTRTDPGTLQGLGNVSGYALEILNQKTEGTFARVARNWRKDWVALIDLVLDVVAWKADQQYGLLDLRDGTVTSWSPPDDPNLPLDIPEGRMPISLWWEVDPSAVFPNRKVSIRIGSGYIVDEVKIRDDFVAELISREEALRKRGYSDREIRKIVKEIDDAKPPAPEIGSYGTPGQFEPSGTQAGSTVASDTEAPSLNGVTP